ncbi:MAG: glycosyltransferase [Luteimonas sp.]
MHGDDMERICLVTASLDLHDVLWHAGLLYVVCTETNAVLELDAGTFAESRRWTLPGEPDSAHVNSVCVHDGRILASRFGAFDVHRGYKGRTRGAGEIFDVETGEVMIAGLSQPHSLKSVDGLLWVCDSEAHMLRAYRNFHPKIAVDLDGYVRGLAFDDAHVCVGLSRGRNDPGSMLDSARIVVLDREQLRERETIALPVDEIYDLLPADMPLAALRAAALKEAFSEINALRHARNVASARVQQKHQQIEGFATTLHEANLRGVDLQQRHDALSTTIDQQHAASVIEQARIDEAVIWNGLLNDEIARLRNIVTAHERVIAAQQRSLCAAARALDTLSDAMAAQRNASERDRARSVAQADLIDRLAKEHKRLSATLEQPGRFIGSVTAPRSWRWTRSLRHIEPEVADLPIDIVVDELQLLIDDGAVRHDSDVAGNETLQQENAARDVLTQLRASAGHGFVAADLDAGPRRAMVPILGLEFPVHDAPEVSIVVTAYGNFEQTLACLRSIRDAGEMTSFEVILIEDASADEEMGRFAHVPGLHYHANPGNLGFLRSANQAAALARGNFVHLLNNDTQVCSGWLDALMQTFVLFHECGMAGSRLLYPDGRLQEAGGIVWDDGNACNYGRGDDPALPQYAVVRDVDYVSGASVLLPITLLRELGGFDERYLPAYYEDTDLAFRVREAGHRVYAQPRSMVVHHEGLSHGTDIGNGIKASQAHNREVFAERWHQTLLHEQLAPGEHVFLARDRAQLKKIVLVIDRHPPQTDRDAGSRAIWQLMRVLFLQGFCIKFWADQPGDDPAYAASLQMHGIEVLSAQTDGAFDDWIGTHGAYLDYVLLSRPMVARDYIDSVRDRTAAYVIFYGHDIHAQRIERQYALDGDPLLKTQSEFVRDIEYDLWRKSDFVLYPSDEETEHVRAWLTTHAVDGRAETVPLFAYEAVPPLDAAAALSPDDRDEILFVGGFAHQPNVDGAIWFTRNVWPSVRALRPGLRLCLVGAEPTAEVRTLAAEDVEITGRISEADLIAHYSRARIAIAPLRFGAGTKGKVLEAMRFGVPCVTTSSGVQGLADAGFLRVADDAQAMTAQIAELLSSSDAWWQASRDGQSYIRSRFSVQTVWRVLSTVMDPQRYPDVQTRRETLAARMAAN